MEYSEFESVYNAGMCSISVDGSKALQVLTTTAMPKVYRYPHIFWSCVWLLSILGFIIGAFFTKGISLIGLLFVSPMIRRAVKRSACDFVVDYVTKSAEFYAYAVTNGVIEIIPKAQET